jgi:hypothetical protein
MSTITDFKQLETRVVKFLTMSSLERERVGKSLAENGVAVIKGFIDEKTLTSLKSDATSSTINEFDAGIALGLAIKRRMSNTTAEFSHPFLISKSAVKIASNRSLIDVVEDYLEDKAIIHHGVFQKSFSISQPAIDWHVDMGSNKKLNANRKFVDIRLRMIIYLSDVKTGGLSYIIDSRDAANYFFKQPDGELYPQSLVPNDSKRKITFNELAGTIILFDAHGLHRPEAPQEERTVLNVWFARSDFSASLPPVLVSIANIDANSFDTAYIFGNERGTKIIATESNMTIPDSLYRKFTKRIYKWLRK